MTATRVTLLVLGVIIGLIGMVMTAVGIGTLVFGASQRDADGFYTSPEYQLTTSGHAITGDDIDLRVEADPAEWAPEFGDVSTRLTAASTDPADEIFIGVAPADDVDRYLGGVGYDVIARLGVEPTDVAYTRIAGELTPAPPTEQTFWVASVAGAGEQQLQWDLESGQWAVVVMNADGTAGIDVAATAGVRTAIVTPIGIGLLVFGLLALGGAITLLVAATAAGRGTGQTGTTPVRRPDEPIAVGDTWSAVDRLHPVAVAARLDGPGPGLWLIKWLLLIPHFVALFFLWFAFVLLTIVAGIAILFTGRYPRGIFAFNSGVLRWSWRVGYYGYSALGTDKYPPFTLADVPDYPARLDIAEPGELSRGLVLIKWWLLAIPHYIVLGILVGNGYSWTFADGNADRVQVAGGGLIFLLTLFAGFALLFTRRYPRGLFDFIMGLNRWVYRVAAYVALMTDEYPPFRFDGGGSEPTPDPPTPDDEPSTGVALDDRSVSRG